jgi:sirohydrochlorin ferrochelatase
MHRSLLAVTLILLSSVTAAAQTGLLVVAHGANTAWNAAVRQTVAQISWPTGPVATAFLRGDEAETSGWDEGVAALERAGARSIVVVPLMVSSAGAHYRQIEFYAGAAPALPAELAGHGHGGPARPSVPVRVTAALDGAPELAARLAEIWTGLPPVDRRGSMMFVAHGPSSDDDAARWLADLRRAIGPTAAAAGVPFDIGLLRDDAAPEIRAAAVADSRARIVALAEATGDSVTVLPVLVSTGRIATATIPRDLIGLPIRYVPAPLTPSAHLARWVERVALARVAGSH